MTLAYPLIRRKKMFVGHKEICKKYAPSQIRFLYYSEPIFLHLQRFTTFIGELDESTRFLPLPSAGGIRLGFQFLKLIFIYLSFDAI